MDNKISVIIPAYNESQWIEKAVESFRNQSVKPLEIIVVDNSIDNGKTRQVAEKCADRVVAFPGPVGVCRARNEGAKIAKGDILLFSDADTLLEKNGLEELSKIGLSKIVGTFWGRNLESGLKHKIFFIFKNWTHYFGVYQGAVAGTFFCSKEIFEGIGGFDESVKIGEFERFVKKAKMAGAKYVLVKNSTAITSMRRYEAKGYLGMIGFWIKWRIASIFKKDKELTKDYFKINGK